MSLSISASIQKMTAGPKENSAGKVISRGYHQKRVVFSDIPNKEFALAIKDKIYPGDKKARQN